MVKMLWPARLCTALQMTEKPLRNLLDFVSCLCID